jgi:hypothetical protein
MSGDANVSYRWIGGVDSEHGPAATAEEWDRIEGILNIRGWMSLNRPTSRVLMAEDAEGNLLGFHVFQFLPYCGPLFIIPSRRATGIAEELSDKMVDFLAENNARGWVVVATSKHSENLCKSRGMSKIESPVYVMSDPGGVDIPCPEKTP